MHLYCEANVPHQASCYFLNLITSHNALKFTSMMTSSLQAIISGFSFYSRVFQIIACEQRVTGDEILCGLTVASDFTRIFQQKINMFLKQFLPVLKMYLLNLAHSRTLQVMILN
ncbi:hypothetical protein T4D_16325 [Trichinella pseudospiralis]|uniref:Uncharacterized protein n=1 Tax=Trichinella pseudospiralis TaxID=6337 RepID=A0A0V1FUP2_TRIPS|nr:hypothetical protein T4D_16325 [Trichinella pseudospiralis]